MIPTCGTLDDTSLRQIDMIPHRALGAQGDCRWLISLDYDGTLRQHEAPHIEEEFFAQMRAWREYGVRWGINTGRSLYFLLEDFARISSQLPDFICTCERYAYITDENGMLHACHDYNRGCYEDHHELRSRVEGAVSHAFQQMQELYPHVSWEIDASDSLSIATETPEGMEVLMPHIYEVQARFPELGMQRAGRFMRFCDARYSKGTALEQVRKSWGVVESHCFIMGDGENDLDTFRAFPKASYAAPKHSHPDVLRYVMSRGGDVKHESVLSALHEWAMKNGLTTE